jgi:hypothetical protein
VEEVRRAGRPKAAILSGVGALVGTAAPESGWAADRRREWTWSWRIGGEVKWV